MPGFACTAKAAVCPRCRRVQSQEWCGGVQVVFGELRTTLLFSRTRQVCHGHMDDQVSVVCLCWGALIRSFTGAGCVTKRTAELELLREENVSADRTNILLTRCC